MERANFTVILYLLAPVTLFIASHIPKRWRFLFAALQLALYIAVVLAIPPGSDPSSDYAFGTTFLSVLSALNFFVLSDPYQEHWQVSAVKGAKPSSATEKSSQDHPVKYGDLDLLGSLSWCFQNSIQIRGIGWNWKIPHLPPGPTQGISRSSYLTGLVMSLTKLYLRYDLSITILRRMTRDGQLPLGVVDALPRAAAVLSFGVANVTLIEIAFTIICLIGAATGLFWTKFEDNHPVIGHVSEGYIIGRFWGRVWHQNMRRVLQAPGKHLSQKILNVKRGSLASRYVQSYTAFFLSGLYHYVAAQTSLPRERFYGTWFFFLLQPNLILFEDFVTSWGNNKLGLTSQKWRYLGYVWTYAALIPTATGFVDECVRFGLVPASSAFPFSLADQLIPGLSTSGKTLLL